MSIDPARVADALRALADAIYPAAPSAPVQTEAAATPPKRGRGRPVPGETPAPSQASPQPAPAVQASAAPDPFAEPAAPAAAPAATIEQVRDALTKLRAATSQENALKVLKDSSGFDNLTSLPKEKYGAVVSAATQAELNAKAAQAPADDPFATPAAAVPAAEQKQWTKEELKALVVATQKRTSPEIVQGVVMKHGGQAPKADGTGVGPSFNALPAEKYAAVAAELQALGTTK